eukprot:17770-Chlamydomonas_euryale.AAC.5
MVDVCAFRAHTHKVRGLGARSCSRGLRCFERGCAVVRSKLLLSSYLDKLWGQPQRAWTNRGVSRSALGQAEGAAAGRLDEPWAQPQRARTNCGVSSRSPGQIEGAPAAVAVLAAAFTRRIGARAVAVA